MLIVGNAWYLSINIVMFVYFHVLSATEQNSYNHLYFPSVNPWQFIICLLHPGNEILLRLRSRHVKIIRLFPGLQLGGVCILLLGALFTGTPELFAGMWKMGLSLIGSHPVPCERLQQGRIHFLVL